MWLSLSGLVQIGSEQYTHSSLQVLRWPDLQVGALLHTPQSALQIPWVAGDCRAQLSSQATPDWLQGTSNHAPNSPLPCHRSCTNHPEASRRAPECALPCDLPSILFCLPDQASPGAFLLLWTMGHWLPHATHPVQGPPPTPLAPSQDTMGTVPLSLLFTGPYHRTLVSATPRKIPQSKA